MPDRHQSRAGSCGPEHAVRPYFLGADRQHFGQQPGAEPKGDPTFEVKFVAASGAGGNLILERPAGGGSDPDTLAQIGGITYSFTYEMTGVLPTLQKDGAGKVPDQFEGSKIMIITVHDYPAAGQSTRISFMPEETASQQDMNGFGTGAINLGSVSTTPAPSPVCLLKGTRIRTVCGERPIEELREGDLVVTADGAAVPVRHVTHQSFRDPGHMDHWGCGRCACARIGWGRVCRRPI
ncbi:Hint domain-containing protein [Gemmobacter nectariphilus]|uniref:Hint domain-containing protein n=1 Tax=Gemmobacter nectariphilus TaxID=220343 RepID=UPI0012B5C0AE|nr:Hint domain-containing protein [Gemmobacter nectariphilus]